MKLSKCLGFVSIVMLLFSFGTVTAGVILDSPLLPPESDPADCNNLVSLYAAPGQHFMFIDGELPLVITNPVFKCFQGVERVPLDLYLGEQQLFAATFEGMIEFMGEQTAFSLTGSMITITAGELPSKDLFSAQIVAMDLSGIVNGIPVMMRHDALRLTQGMTDVVDLGGGQFQVDSFFDVFAEVSVDGGVSWVQQTTPVRMDLMYANDPVPVDTRSSWGEVKSLYR